MKKYIHLTFVLISFCVLAQAQVGINETNPNQKLDVNGKIEVGNDNNPATKGAIRYDSTNNDFEGYDGSNWNSFTMNRGMLPNGATPYYGKATVSSNGSLVSFTLHDMALNSSSFGAVPFGKFFIVTGASFHGPSNDATVGTNYTIRIFGNFYPDEEIWLRGRHENGPQSLWINGAAPLIILQGGETLRAQHPNIVDDQSSVIVFVRGWLVDNVNY